VGLAAVIGAALYALKGAETAQAYFAGYLLEQSLSVDNLFVFVLVFRYFGVSGPGQDRVLAWGIASAAVLRLLMVAAGAELIENFKPVLLVFAGILVYSSIKLAFVDSGDGDDEGEKEDLSDNAIVKICKRVLTVSDEYDGVKFFTEVPVAGDDEIGGSASSSSSSSSSSTSSGGDPSSSLVQRTKRVATPLLLVLAVIELSDVVFAVDSVPAVFGVSRDPVVVWSASMAAIASLRALYGFVATALGTLKYLDKAVAAVLAWVGGKMIFEFFSGIEVSTALSLGVVVASLAVGVGASLAVGSAEEEKKKEG
jgi:TerC family integral membrane protein